MIALSVTVTVGAFVLGLAVPPEDNAKLKPAGKTPPLVFISMLLPALPVWLGLFATSLFVGVLRWVGMERAESPLLPIIIALLSDSMYVQG